MARSLGAWSVAFVLAPVIGLGGTPDVAQLKPRVLSQTTLSALPENIAQGPSGPINRIAFELTNFNSSSPRARVVCEYAGGVRYGCKTQRGTELMPPERERVVVEIPDFDRGREVTVRFANEFGATQATVTVVNRPRTLHEIESVLLTHGGQTTTDGNGRTVPLMQTTTMRASTLPAIATDVSLAQVDSRCGGVYARWLNANATDVVVSSNFGVLTGTVVLARAPERVTVRSDNGPDWLITYPLGAVRAQFIAHYEIEYRVAPCPT